MIKLNHSGFTLIEVLVASVILFATLATISVIYRGALISTSKATDHVAISSVVPAIVSIVRENIRSKGNTPQAKILGSGTSWGVIYEWGAELTKFKAAPPIFDPDSGGQKETQPKYKLWQVNLSLKLNGVVRLYEYKELSWNEK